ncbi:hypothetical protein [Bacillus atrophaeus]|uniref:hypothetical protein n=1 Tax=Bacillus atrophaeus TaxID=1452 RepID=UPI0030F492E5
MRQTVLLLFGVLMLAGCGAAASANQADSSPKFTQEGKYIGEADRHTIAVNIDGEEKMIEVPKNKRAECESLPDYTKVQVKYTKDDNGTLKLEDIKENENL